MAVRREYRLVRADSASGKPAKGSPFRIDFIVGSSFEHGGVCSWSRPQSEAPGVEQARAGRLLSLHTPELRSPHPASGLRIEHRDTLVLLGGDVDHRGRRYVDNARYVRIRHVDLH